MDYQIPVSKENYNKAMIKVLNCFLNLTDYEINILSTMLNSNIKVLSTDSRKQLRTLMDTDTYTFNNHIMKLRKSNTLVATKFGLAINPNLLNTLTDKKINIEFNVD